MRRLALNLVLRAAAFWLLGLAALLCSAQDAWAAGCHVAEKPEFAFDLGPPETPPLPSIDDQPTPHAHLTRVPCESETPSPSARPVVSLQTLLSAVLPLPNPRPAERLRPVSCELRPLSHHSRLDRPPRASSALV